MVLRKGIEGTRLNKCTLKINYLHVVSKKLKKFSAKNTRGEAKTFFER